MHRARRLGLALLALSSLASGCEAPTEPRRTPTTAPTDKAALFGDPSLVPTRDGERARRELGLAQEVAVALELLPTVVETTVSVESDDTGAASERVMVVMRGRADADADRLGAQARTIARQVVGPRASIEVLVELEATASSPSPSNVPSLPWPLAIGLLGLGFCTGVVVERARRIRAASHRPSRRRR